MIQILTDEQLREHLAAGGASFIDGRWSGDGEWIAVRRVEWFGGRPFLIERGLFVQGGRIIPPLLEVVDATDLPHVDSSADDSPC